MASVELQLGPSSAGVRNLELLRLASRSPGCGPQGIPGGMRLLAKRSRPETMTRCFGNHSEWPGLRSPSSLAGPRDRRRRCGGRALVLADNMGTRASVHISAPGDLGSQKGAARRELLRFVHDEAEQLACARSQAAGHSDSGLVELPVI